MLKKELLKIKEEVEIFFQKMGFRVETSLSPKDQTLKININSGEPQILIGERGQILAEIQRLLKTILKRKFPAIVYINLDVNDYKKKKTQYLKELAREMAEEVSLTKKERILHPMFSYERRIIHLELADRKNIATESVGREPYRRVIIRPHP